MKNRIYINKFGFDHLLTEITLKTDISLTYSIIVSYRSSLSIVSTNFFAQQPNSKQAKVPNSTYLTKIKGSLMHVVYVYKFPPKN
jgi:hypothetical protein